MADDEDDDDPIDNGVAPTGPIIQPTNGAARAAPAGPEGGQGEGVQQVKHSDFKRIKEEQRAKGRQQALADLDAKAQAAGFTSHDDALKALASLQQKKPAQPVEPTIQPQGAQPMSTKPKQNDPAKEAERLRLEQARATDDKSKMRKQWRVENRKNRELQAQLQAKDAEIALREECYRAGVKDVDYTIRLLTRELAGKTQEEIGKYDRAAFYEGLKKDKPYLFGETVVAATTGTGGEVKKDGATAANGNGGAGPTPPAPGQAAVADAEKKQFDARKASPQEVQDRLRALGLNPHL